MKRKRKRNAFVLMNEVGNENRSGNNMRCFRVSGGTRYSYLRDIGRVF